MKRTYSYFLLSLILTAATLFSNLGFADVKIGAAAPQFELKNQDGKIFKLADRKGKDFTVLFFYPKAGTPGCTTQACAFRDSIKVIRDQGADVYGISADDVAAEKKFHDEHKMTFDLLSDLDDKVINLYGVKMADANMAKRQTFILDKDLIVRAHYENVDPALDAKNVAKLLEGMKGKMVGAPAPRFELKNQDGKVFKLTDRKDKGFTALFFYPKAGTPGCTTQACAFRDSIKLIRDQGAEVYGISADDVAAEKKFHEEHKMTFDLLSDPQAKVIEMYDVKMAVVSMAKRQTFILDKNLVIRAHFENVDPALDAKIVAKSIEGMNR